MLPEAEGCVEHLLLTPINTFLQLVGMPISPYVLSCLPIILSEIMRFIISEVPSNILVRYDFSDISAEK